MLSACRLLLGFAHNVCGVPLEQLSLKTLVPSPDRDGVSLLMDYQQWRQQQRGTAISSATVAIKAVMHVARFLYHDLARVCYGRRQLVGHSVEVRICDNAGCRIHLQTSGCTAQPAAATT